MTAPLDTAELRACAQNEHMIDQYYLETGHLLNRAADELDRLRAENERLRAERDRMKEALEEIAWFYEQDTEATTGHLAARMYDARCVARAALEGK